MEYFVNNIVPIITLIVGIIGGVSGGILALYQWNKNLKLKRADYLYELSTKLRTDEVLSDVVKYFDYDEPWYNDTFHEEHTIEKKIDTILSFFSYICYLKNRKMISNKEFRIFKYEIDRILKSNQTQDYLFNIYHFSKKNNEDIPFYYLFQYAENNKMIDKEFYNSNSKRYSHNLNF